jgi:formyl-CoA transferase
VFINLIEEMNRFMKLPLEGIKIIDMTGVQAGPACTQMLAWMGADVLKVEQVGQGDVTRRQLRDIPGVDALYFTQLNSNKRSIELNTKTPEGKKVLERLIKEYDIMVENFAPGAMDRMGFTWERIHELNPKLIFGSINDLKVYENVAQCAGGSASVTGFWDGPPLVAGSALGDSNTGMHMCIGLLAALRMREKTGLGQRVDVAMQATNINLNRVKLRDQLRLEKTGILEEYPQYAGNGEFRYGGFGDAVPRGGNAGGGGQPGWVLKCKGWETDPNAYIYMTIQEQNWKRTAEAIGKPEWVDDPEYNTARARNPHIFDIFKYIEDTILFDKTKDEAVDYLRKFDIPTGPVKSMKEIAHDPELRESGTIVEVDHKVRGKYLTVGCPMKFSAFKPDIKESPLLGEHTEQVLNELGFSKEEIADMYEKKAVAATYLTQPQSVTK